MQELIVRTELRAGPIEETVLEGLPEAVFGHDGWATTITRGFTRELVDAVSSGRLGSFGDAVRIAVHVPSTQDIRIIANAVCDAASSFVAISGLKAEGIARRIAEVRASANEVLDTADQSVPGASTSAEAAAACDTLLHVVSVSRPELFGHLESISALSVRIARQLERDAETIEAIRLAGFLHDVGLLTTGTDPALAERDPGHSKLSHHCLVGIPALKALAPIVGAHHERFDGTGQPDGLRGAEIPLEARIIAVADAFEHLANRAGRSNPIAAAISDIWQESGGAFDPDVVAAVTRMFNQHSRIRRTASGRT